MNKYLLNALCIVCLIPIMTSKVIAREPNKSTAVVKKTIFSQIKKSNTAVPKKHTSSPFQSLGNAAKKYTDSVATFGLRKTLPVCPKDLGLWTPLRPPESNIINIYVDDDIVATLGIRLNKTKFHVIIINREDNKEIDLINNEEIVKGIGTPMKFNIYVNSTQIAFSIQTLYCDSNQTKTKMFFKINYLNAEQTNVSG